MFDILKDNYFNEHYSTGFIDTNMFLSDELADEIRQHYMMKEEGHNDFPKFFAQNEHQAYMEGKALGFLLNTFPNFAQKTVKKLYDKTYKKAVYCEQAFIDKVLNHLLEKGFERFFKTRYMVVSYDMYLRSDHNYQAAGIHTDLPNFHHFYETENDLSIYIPLVDLDADSGGRIKALPEQKLKVPGNILLKLLHQHFSNDPELLDVHGYIDPDKISPEAIDLFVKSKPYQDLMASYKGLIGFARKEYADEFQVTDESKGKVLLFNNKNFHFAEPWKNTQIDREIYAIRMFPVYDIKINLKKKLHGVPVNIILLDTHKGEIIRHEDRIDLSQLVDADKAKL